MKQYNALITLNKNSRGCYILDTVKGCEICHDKKPMGCYDNCYAKRIADRYGYDFSNPILRELDIDKTNGYLFDVKDQHHLSKLIAKIKDIDMPFIRIGDMGDPSFNWQHTIDICEKLSIAGKTIVIITKHWNIIPNDLLNHISKLDICINTSVSALDSNYEIYNRRIQYERLQKYCKSVLRVVTCNFNIETREGLEAEIMQEYLLSFDNVLETIFRPDNQNRLIQDGIINVKKVKFMGTNCLASMRNDNIYIGYCNTCPDMCGLSNKFSYTIAD